MENKAAIPASKECVFMAPELDENEIKYTQPGVTQKMYWFKKRYKDLGCAYPQWMHLPEVNADIRFHQESEVKNGE